MNIIEKLDSMALEPLPFVRGGKGRPKPLSKNGIEADMPPKLFTILKMRMPQLTANDILSFKEYGGEKNDVCVNINPKKFDIRYEDIKVLANRFGMTGLKYEDMQIRIWFSGNIIWDVIS